MVTLPSCRHHGVSVTQVVARRQVRMHLRKIREREYTKLRALVPSVASRKKVTKVQVIEEAVRYIEELQLALMDRFKQKHGSMAKDKAQEVVDIFVNKMMTTDTTGSPKGSNHNCSARPFNGDSGIRAERHDTDSSFHLWRNTHLDSD